MSPLVQAMAGRPKSAKLISKPALTNLYGIPGPLISFLNIWIFFAEYSFENFGCEMSAIFSRAQSVKICVLLLKKRSLYIRKVYKQ